MANEDKLLEMMSSMAQSIEGLKNGLADLRIEMKQGFKEVNDRIDALEKKTDARFDAVDRKFEEVDARFAKVDERFDRVDERFDKVEEEIRNINSRELHIMELANKGRRTA